MNSGRNCSRGVASLSLLTPGAKGGREVAARGAGAGAVIEFIGQNMLPEILFCSSDKVVGHIHHTPSIMLNSSNKFAGKLIGIILALGTLSALSLVGFRSIDLVFIIEN